MQCFETTGATSWYQLTLAVEPEAGPMGSMSVPHAPTRPRVATASRVFRMGLTPQQASYRRIAWSLPTTCRESRRSIARTGLADAGTRALVHDLPGRVELLHLLAGGRLGARQVVHARLDL